MAVWLDTMVGVRVAVTVAVRVALGRAVAGKSPAITSTELPEETETDIAVGLVAVAT